MIPALWPKVTLKLFGLLLSLRLNDGRRQLRGHRLFFKDVFLRFDHRSGRLVQLGFSLGGGIAMLLASGQPMEIKSLVTWSSVGDFQADMLAGLGQKAFDRAKEDGVVGLDLGFRTIVLKQAFFDSLGSYKLDDAISTYPGAYLTIAGSKDFSAQYADRFVGLAKNATKEAMIIPEGDHIFGVLGPDQTMADSVIQKTADWFAATLVSEPKAQ